VNETNHSENPTAPSQPFINDNDANPPPYSEVCGTK